MNSDGRARQPEGADEEEKGRATQWLSQGLEGLIAEREGGSQRDEYAADFDVIVIGSGYGGAVAAAELAALRGDKTVCVLERGREYLPGAFPGRMSELASHVRFTGAGASRPRGYREGLFDVRIGEDVCAVLANGVGGGSLINAGVMEMPAQAVFLEAAWPKALRSPAGYDELVALGDALRRRLGATHTVADVGDPAPLKHEALRQLGPAAFKSVPITVALAEGVRTDAGVSMSKCVRCGDCATGCNRNAKISLDVSLLAEAAQHGARLYTGATVLRIERQAANGAAPALWKLQVVHTDENLRRRHGKPFALRARCVVLAAGTLGSTEILMRSASDKLRFSNKLGHQFSANGDLIAVAHATELEANCVGDETRVPADVQLPTRVGPTITGMLDLRASEDVVVQDLSVPGPLRRLFEEIVTTSSSLHLLGEADRETHRPGDPASKDWCSVDAGRIRNTLAVAMMARDTADGVLRLQDGDSADDADAGDGAIAIHWPSLREHPPLREHHRRLQERVTSSGMKGRVLPNPLWQLLPDKLDYLMGGQTGPLLTVHPLGGCPMGDDAASGVVDDCGRVFDAAAGDGRSKTHEGLVVLDGAIIPTSLGINPALAIGSVALRAVAKLRAEWGYTEPSGKKELAPRPRFRDPPVIAEPLATEIEVLERLSGKLPLAGFGWQTHVELTLRFDPIEARMLTAPGAELSLGAHHGRLRVFDTAPPDDREAPDASAIFVASVSGQLRVFRQKDSGALRRRLRGLWAWFRNRGLRDSVHWAIDHWRGEGPPPVDGKGVFAQAGERLRSAWDLASRAGAVRLLEYDLTIDRIVQDRGRSPERGGPFAGKAVRLRKQLTYSRRGNPWRQLMAVRVQQFPGFLLPRLFSKRKLELDTGYLARQGVPLLRIVGQQDHAAALADLACVGLYLLRMLLHVHVWSFRAPDRPRPRKIEGLPGKVPGLPAPVVKDLPVAALPCGTPVMLRLTRYPFGAAQRERALREKPQAAAGIATPVLMIHGYSAGGTTFAHHSVRPNLASTLWDAGRDVWILDMRTSAGMPHARRDWSFEETAYADIPVAMRHVLQATGREQLDVFAHCMGSAMLGMALLGPREPGAPFEALRENLHLCIRRLAMSQIAPAMVFTAANVFRAYAMRYLQHYLPLGDYQFRPPGEPGLADQLIDRLLATLPYPEEEFDRENPFWTPWRRTPWVGTRHRMDALYGRDFSLNNVPQTVLDHIDDHFGPLSVETVSQAMHFARFRTITDKSGFNAYVSPARLYERYAFPMLSVHGQDNGLASVATLEHFKGVLEGGSSRLTVIPYSGFGHQDCLIGKRAHEVFRDVLGFFDEAQAPPPAQAGPGVEPLGSLFASQVPAYGPRLLADAGPGEIVLSAGDDGGRGIPLFGVFVPVVRQDEAYMLVSELGPVEPSKENFIRLATVAQPDPVGNAEEHGRVKFDLERGRLTRGADGLLTLLMYRQSDRIGQPSPIVEPRSLRDAADALAPNIQTSSLPLPDLSWLVELLLEKMAASLKKAFDETSVVNLGLGLVRPLPQPPNEAAPPLPAKRSFALASCQYPAGMLDRTPPGTPETALPGPADSSYLRLAERLDGGGGEVPAFLVLAGDQVYVDATAGLFDPRALDDRYRLPYEHFLGSRGARAVLGRLPAYMLLDDHEIDDNWEPAPPEAKLRRGAAEEPDKDNEALRQRGVAAFLHHQRDTHVAPGAQAPRLWSDEPIGGFPFFLADSRTERRPRRASGSGKVCMLGARQAVKLRRWLRDTSLPGPRFLVSSAMVLPRALLARQKIAASALRSDAWDGYPASLYHLLAEVYERGSGDVVFLSGDAHLGNVTRIALTRSGSEREVLAHSVHCPALYAPFPFANAVEEDFARIDSFEFSWPDPAGTKQTYRCTTRSWFPTAGDGYAVLTVAEEATGWRVTVEFDAPAGGLGSRSFDITKPAP